jgi:hypothetical protein
MDTEPLKRSDQEDANNFVKDGTIAFTMHISRIKKGQHLATLEHANADFVQFAKPINYLAKDAPECIIVIGRVKNQC